jgi:serine/threonine-protein kinase
VADVLDRLQTALVDRYAIKRELGAGGMATVYLADDVRHGRQVALKLLRPELGAVLGGERFLREIHVAASLSHPHILPLHDSGEVDGLFYYVMPYVAGESLRQCLERQTQLSVEEAIELARHVAAALDYAHREGVIHRDIKPENILLQEGQAVVADFGIARALREAGGERLTETGLSLGTPHYMSPEQASGAQELDARADIYALGCVLYEMLAGDPPFTGPTGQAVIARQLVDPVPSIRTVRPTVPEELERAIEKALAKVPADRYSTARAFVEAAGAAAQVEVVPTREQRVPRRRASPKAWRVVAALALTVAAAITTGLLLAPSDWLGRELPEVAFSNIRQATRAPETEIEPAISPDGGEVVYTSGFGLNMSLHVRDLGGGRALALTADRPGMQHWPRWTADGRNIVFVERSAGGVVSYLIPRLGGPISKIVDGRIWDVRDSLVVYLRGDSLLMRSITGGDEAFVARAPPEPHSVTWSPDGSKLAYVQGNSAYVLAGAYNLVTLGNIAPSSIWIIRADGGNPVQVTDHTSLNVSPAWMPDGEHLMFVSNRNGPRDVYLIRVDASGRPRGQPNQVTTGLDAHSISVSTDGSRAAYSRFTFRRNVWQIAIPETGRVSIANATQLTFGNQTVENHGLSWDGRWLAFDSNLEGNQDIYVMPVEGGEPRRVTSDPGDDFHPDFSPDGQEIVFYSSRDGRRDLFLVSADGTNEVRLTDEPGVQYLHPSFSPDGLWICFTRFKVGSTSPEIYVMSRNVVGGEWSEPQQLTRNGGLATRWSPDGNQIVYRAGNGLWITPLQGVERLLLDGEAAGLNLQGGIPDWSRDSRFVYVWGADSSATASLYEIPAAGGSPREVVRFDDAMKDVWPIPSVGDHKVYLSVAEHESDIYVMDLEMR